MKVLQGTYTVAAQVAIDDDIDLLTIEKVIPSAKTQLLYSIKKAMHDKADSLTIEDVAYQTIQAPVLPEVLADGDA